MGESCELFNVAMKLAMTLKLKFERWTRRQSMPYIMWSNTFSSHVEAFMRVITCTHILQGYGLSETCVGTFVSLPNQFHILGTVGPPLPNMNVCFV
ncbi:hypothetical protein H5410_061127 [Solanum commersonii]|uniref:AMP-dependent synthetase/ligase domain-containing protein n=1 Tax=Solanum commersonii TaxID=4109 RepID=A0A9J5W7B0_SOLCO|nr:hypothetical protein H5410_061127 [Solanum commersonii]